MREEQGKCSESVSPGDDNQQIVDELVNLLNDIESDKLPSSIGCRDVTVAAYLEWLSQRPEQMDEVIGNALGHYHEGYQVDTRRKSDVIRLLLRIGLQEVHSEHMDLLRSATSENALRKV